MAYFIDRLAKAESLVARLAAKDNRTPEEQRRLDSLAKLLRRIELERVGRGPYPNDDPGPGESQRRVAMRVALDEQLERAVEPD